MLTGARSPAEAPNVLEWIGLGVLAEVTLRVEFEGLRVEFRVVDNRPKEFAIYRISSRGNEKSSLTTYQMLEMTLEPFGIRYPS
jgi:hypothetical protein